MAETIVLEATKRDVLGKQVKQLRAEGLIPGVLYGPTFGTLPVQMKWLELRPVLREAGGSHLIQLRVEGEAHNALVREVQRDPIRGDVLHVDFYRVRMDVAIRAEVPLELIGSDKTIQANGGTVMRKMTSIVVECLPGDLPSNVQLDISSFTNVGEMLTVAALPVLPGVKYMANPAEIVAVTTLLTQREEEEIEGVSSSEPELIRRKAEEFDEE